MRRVDKPLSIDTGDRMTPTCPRCGSAMIVVGRITDSQGHPILFSGPDEPGPGRPLGRLRSCYCNDCGEVTLTLE